MKRSILLFALLAKSLIHAQDYHPPVDIPIQLSGTFAELRGTHFHAGIDIRTQSKEGLPLTCSGGWICFTHKNSTRRIW